MYLVSLAFVCFALIHSPLSSPSCDVSDFSELPRVRPRRLAAGGDDGIRTHDPLLAGQVLSQLSYTPIILGFLFFLECPPLPLESLFRSHRRVTASFSSYFLEFWLRHCRRSLKIEQQASHTRICTLLDLSSSVVIILLYFKTTKSRKLRLQISCSP